MNRRNRRNRWNRSTCFAWTTALGMFCLTGRAVALGAEPAVGHGPRKIAAHAAESPRGMVATVQPIATQAGVAALEAGGNAVDAALTLGVVDGHNSGIGGGCLILVRMPEGQYLALDGRETAPAAATRDMFVRDGRLDAEASQTGPLAVAVPGAVAAYDELVRRFGRRKLSDALVPAAQVAADGFVVDANYADKLRRSVPTLQQFPESRRVLLKPDGSPYAAGELLRQPDLAATYRALAELGPTWFYRGPFAERVERWMAAHGGILRKADFAAYRPKWREPIKTSYRGFVVVGFPPPSSGGVHIAQMLQILEQFDLSKAARREPAERLHVIAETMKLAFADRAYWLGDPDFAAVPRGLVDPEYARQLARRIDREKASPVTEQGRPPRAESDRFEKHTTHIAAADADGWWVGITTTVNTTFGSKVIVPETGVVLNNEMDDFSIQPGIPNAFGLVGAEANAVGPGKRPLSSMTPTIVERDGQPVLTIGAAGGPAIISQVLLAVTNVIDLGMPIDEAIAAGRIHHQWRPDTLRIERRLADDTLVRELERRGHVVERVDGLGVSQGIQWDSTRRVFVGAHDPRVPGRAAGR